MESKEVLILEEMEALIHFCEVTKNSVLKTIAKDRLKELSDFENVPLIEIEFDRSVTKPQWNNTKESSAFAKSLL